MKTKNKAETLAPPATAPADQMSLIDGESDDALLAMSDAQMRKRYTAAQALKLAERLDPIKAMLGKGVFTVEEIAKACHVNHRTVQKIAELYAHEIGRNMDELGSKFLGEAAAVVELAKSKRDKANYRDLMVGAGILATNGVAMKNAAAGSAPEKDVTEVSQVSERAEAIRKALAESIQPQMNTDEHR